MSYFTAQPSYSGPPGPLRVTPALGEFNTGSATNFRGAQCPCTPVGSDGDPFGMGGNEGAATNYRAAQCPCTPVGADAQEGSMFNGLAVAALAVGGFLFLMRKTRRR